MNWEDRSLSYLCRSFDQLYRGQDYGEALPVIHIGFLDYSPYEVTKIDHATEEDKRFQIDYWARIFKATTWEEIQMMAMKNEYLSEASQALFELNADEIAHQKCRAREDYMRLHNTIVRKLAAQEKALAEKDHALAEQTRILAEKDATIALLQAQLAELQKGRP